MSGLLYPTYTIKSDNDFYCKRYIGLLKLLLPVLPSVKATFLLSALSVVNIVVGLTRIGVVVVAGSTKQELGQT